MGLVGGDEIGGAEIAKDEVVAAGVDGEMRIAEDASEVYTAESQPGEREATAEAAEVVDPKAVDVVRDTRKRDFALSR